MLMTNLLIAWTSACNHGWLARARISLVISKRYRCTMMVLHLQCRHTIKLMPSKRYSIETSHAQREQTARPLGPDTHLLEVWRHNPIWPPTMLPRLTRLLGMIRSQIQSYDNSAVDLVSREIKTRLHQTDVVSMDPALVITDARDLSKNSGNPAFAHPNLCPGYALMSVPMEF